MSDSAWGSQIYNFSALLELEPEDHYSGTMIYKDMELSTFNLEMMRAQPYSHRNIT